VQSAVCYLTLPGISVF